MRTPVLTIVAFVLGGCPKPASAPTTVDAEPVAPAGPARGASPVRSKAEAGERGRLAGLTAAHNAERAKVGVAPLRWSRDLARHAQSWADRLAADGCSLEHHRNDAYGENLYWSSNAASASAVVAKWAEESRQYDHRRNSCKGVCGHYTQVVWGETRSLGCGVANCGPAEIWVCNYDPPGNVVGQSPY